MMTFDQFKRFVETLDVFFEREEQLSKALEPFNDSSTVIVFCPEVPNTIVTYIQELFNDKGEWFTYWYYDLESGKSYKDGNITDEDGKNIVLKTVEDIYNFLTNERNDG